MKERKLNNKGFSLVELIIVIAIMVILVVVFAPQYLRFVNNSRISTDVQTAANIATAVETSIAEGQTPFGNGNTNVTRNATNPFTVPASLTTIPASRFAGQGYGFQIIGNDVDGVDHIDITDGTHTYRVYPNAEDDNHGINNSATDATEGRRGLRQ